MKTTYKFASLAVLSSALLVGCGSPQSNQPVATYPSTYPSGSPAYSVSYGVVDSIQAVNSNASSSTGGIGLGTVAGGVVGGVLGNQVGSGSGRTAATAAGAIGGAVVGHGIDQRRAQNQQVTAYQLGVRLDNGSFQTITQDNVSGIGVGSRVRVENGRAYAY